MAQAVTGDPTARLTHAGSGSVYGNLGSGTQSIHEQGGRHNRQYSARHMTIIEGPPSGDTSHQPYSRLRPWVVNRTANPLFIGREATVQEVVAALKGSQSASTAQRLYVLTGLAGIGKSEISLQVINHLRPELWGVFWIDAGSEKTLLSDYLAAAEAIGSVAENVDQARRALAACSEPWLLVLDNADNPQVNYLQLLPSGSYGSILITSRNPKAGRYSTVGSKEIGSLDTNSARNLLLETANVAEHERAEHKNAADNIVKLLEGHTLALAVAGSLIAEDYCGFEDFPAKYEKGRLKFNQHQGYTEYKGVYAVFDTALALFPADDPVCCQDAESLLGFMSSIDHKGVPLDVFEAAWSGSQQLAEPASLEENEPSGLSKALATCLPAIVQHGSQEWDGFRFRKAVSLLRSLSLVQDSKTHADTHSKTHANVHSLVHSWARDRLDTDQQKRADVAAASTIAIAYRSGWNWWKYQLELRLHLSKLAPAKLSFDELLPSGADAVLYLCADIFFDLAAYSELEQCIAVLKETYSGHGKEQAMRELSYFEAIISSRRGHVGQSLSLLQKLSRDIEMAGDSQEIQLKVDYELASAYRANGQVDKTIQLLERMAGSLPEDHPDQLTVHHTLASAYREDGQVGKAIKLLERIVEIEKTSLAEDHPDRLASQHTLGNSYRVNGQVGKAIQLLERVVEIEKISLAEDHPDRLASEHALATAYRKDGQTGKAIELLERVLEVRTISLAEDHPDRLSSEHALAVAYHFDGQVGKAIELLQRVVEIRKTSLAEDHPDRLASQFSLAVAYQNDGQAGKAVELLERVVEIRKTSLAEAHPDRLMSQHALAVAYRKDGQAGKAVELLERVVAIEKTSLAGQPPAQTDSQLALLLAYLANDQVDKAVETLRDMMESIYPFLPRDHPDRTLLERMQAPVNPDGHNTRHQILVEYMHPLV